MTATRSWPVPNPALTTLHFIGDMHFGTLNTIRSDKLKADLGHKLVPKPKAHFQVGDLVNDGLGSQDTTSLAWLASVTDAPVYVTMGNHDIWNDVRTAAAWEAAYAAYLPSGTRNYTVDFTDLRVVVIAADNVTSWPVQLGSTMLTYLDTQLGATTKDCWIMCHGPLNNTVLGGATEFQSIDAGFYMQGPNGTDDTQIRAVLGSHANAKLWVCGHTHSNLFVPGFAALTTCGSRQVAHINASAIAYTGQTADKDDPVNSIYLTRNLDGSVDVRFRSHGGGVWTGPSSSRVTTLSPS